MTRYKKLLAILIPAWFLIAFSASALDVFKNDAQRIGGAVAIAAATPMLLFAVAFAGSASFRRFTLSLDPQLLTLVQSWRFLGFVFVLLQARNLLPAIFALPAGYGDMAIGLTATYVALKLGSPQHRSSFIAWQVLGIVDLVMAVGLGTTARILSPAGASTARMTVLPLSLVPTFIVPLLLMFHVICIAQARQWGRTPRDLGSSRLAGAIG